jgi:hypothetical protein
MAEISSRGERRCVRCGAPEEEKSLDTCSVCLRFFCPDCAHRALGRRFCSAACGQQFFYGDPDDDENLDDDAG